MNAQNRILLQQNWWHTISNARKICEQAFGVRTFTYITYTRVWLGMNFHWLCTENVQLFVGTHTYWGSPSGRNVWIYFCFSSVRLWESKKRETRYLHPPANVSGTRWRCIQITFFMFFPIPSIENQPWNENPYNLVICATLRCIRVDSTFVHLKMLFLNKIFVSVLNIQSYPCIFIYKTNYYIKFSALASGKGRISN